MAKSRSIGSIYAELTLKDKMSKGIMSARKSLNSFGSAAIKSAAIAGGVLSAAMVGGTKRALSMTDELVDVSSQTGIAIADMMKLQQAYKDGGREASNVGKDVSKMQKALVGANNGGSDPFASMGLSAKQLINLDPAEQFKQIGAAIMRIQNPAERTAKAMEIFGKGGMGLTTVFEGLPAAEKALGRMPELAQRFGAAMGEANDLIGHLPLKSDQFFMGFTAGIIGELLPGLKQIDEHDFTTVGENLGTSLATAFSAITDGTIWEIFALNAQKAMATIESSNAINGISAALNAAFDKFESYATDPSAVSFSDQFQKYTEAGIEANTDLIDDLQAKLDALNQGIKDKFSQRRSMAEGAAKARGAAAPITELLKPLSAADSGANEYQRRGLSLDGAGGTASKITEQTNLMREMRDALLRMADKPMTATF
jgi:hypothetical protein